MKNGILDPREAVKAIQGGTGGGENALSAALFSKQSMSSRITRQGGTERTLKKAKRTAEGAEHVSRDGGKVQTGPRPLRAAAGTFDVSPAGEESNASAFDIDPATVGTKASPRSGPLTADQRIGYAVSSIGQTLPAAVALGVDTAGQYLKNNARTAERADDPARKAIRDRMSQLVGQIDYLERFAYPTRSAARQSEQWKRLNSEMEGLKAKLDAYTVKDAVPMDSAGMRLMTGAIETREKALEGMTGAPRWLAEQGISIGQNLAMLPTAAIHPALPLAGMGAIAAGDKMYELNAQGKAPEEALGRGLLAGGIEAATEKIPLDTLMDVVKTGGRSALKNLLKQAGVEAGEESLSYVMNYIADKAARDPNASFSMAELANSAAGGAFSGLVLGGLGTATNHLAASGYLPRAGETEGALPKAVWPQKEGDPSTHGVNGTNPPPARTGSPGYGSTGQVLNMPQNGPQLTPEAPHGANLSISASSIADASAGGNTQDLASAQAQKTASTGEAGAYRAAKPENVELPTVPIINLSMRTVADMNGGVLPQTGNVLRKQVISRARTKLGLDQSSEIYIPASNVMRNGEEYVLKITRSSLDKMLSPSNGGIVSPESIAVIDNIERIANNGVYFKSEGDRKGRQQIAGYDHLMTTVYIDNQPYSVDLRVRVYDDPAGGENRLYYFTPEEIVTTKKVGAKLPTGTLHERTMIQEEVPTVAPIIADASAGGNTQSARTAGGLSGPGTDGGRPLPRAGEAQGEKRYLPRAGETPAAQQAQKTASTGEMGTGLVPLTEQAAANLATGKNNIVARTINDIVSFVKNARSKKGGSERLYMGTIPDSAARLIRDQTGVEVSGYTAILPGSSVQHIFKNHGDTQKEATRGQRAVSAEDIAQIPKVLASPDVVTLSEDTDVFGRPVLLFSKQIGDTYITAQAVTDGRHMLATNTLWIQKKKNPLVTESNAAKRDPAHNAQSVPPSGSSFESPPSGVDASMETPTSTSKTTEPELSSAPIIADSSAKGNTQYAQNSGGQTGDDGVGAANAGFSGDYNRLQNQSERFHPEGEKAARPVDVPVEDFQGRSIPKSAATVLEAGATPDSAVEVIEQAIANGEFSFDRITDEAAQKRARQTVESKGWDAARESFHQQAAGGKAGKHTMALGQLLLNNAMNAGDSRAVIDILTDYAALSTQSAQAMQAQRMLKKLSPEGQLYGIQRSVENLRGELAERYGDKAPDLNIDEALVDQFLQAQDQAGRDAAMEKIYRDIARQVPATWMDKWNAWRYLAMLGNPRTHVRNIVGNAAFAPVRMVKNAIGTALESGVDYLSPNGIQRTKAALNPASAEDRALVQAAFADLANVQEQLLGGGKYSESAMGKIDRYRTIFRTLPLEAVRKANSAAMDVEDTWFSRPAYAGALAGYLKANGITAQALSDGTADASAMDAARAYAVREAQRATYRDSNAFSDFVSGLRYRGKNPVGQAANVVMEGVLPFRKTPANILMRGVEYSPAGLAKGLSYDLAKVHSGEMTAAQAIDNISAGLTGTGLLALGAWLASIGLVSGGGSGDDEQDVMSDLTGGQDYALTVGDRNFTLDWLAPEALPFFVGVELWNAMTDRGADGVQFKDALSAMERITDPMLEMSMLQGLQDAIDNVRYADGGTLPKVVANAAVSYLSQGVPTLFGQLERTSEYRRDTTFVDRASWMPNDMQYTLGRVMNKLPGEFQQIPYVDAWGRQKSTGNPAERSFNNFLNPAYTSRENETEADKEIQRLLRAGQSGVVPKRTPQSVEVTYKENPKDAENQKRYLNAEEYVSYATVKGQTSYELAMDMINSDEYRSMTDEQKAEALKLAYAYAGHVAAEEVTDGKHESEAYVALAQAAKKELGLSEAEYLLLYEEYGGALVNGDKVREAYQQGMEPETWLEYASGKSAYNSDGEGGLTIAETAKSIRESGLTNDQQELLWLVSYPEWPEKADKAGVPISDYIAYKAATAGLKKSAEKKAALIDAGLPLSLYDKIG